MSTKKTNIEGKKLSGSPGHMLKHTYYRNLEWTFQDLLPCCCFALKTKSSKICWQVSQLAYPGKGSDMSELRSCAKRFGGSRSFIRPCPHP